MCIRDSSDTHIFQKILNNSNCIIPVSYTHLDVYKRQVNGCTGDNKLKGENGRQIDKVIEIIE